MWKRLKRASHATKWSVRHEEEAVSGSLTSSETVNKMSETQLASVSFLYARPSPKCIHCHCLHAATHETGTCTGRSLCLHMAFIISVLSLYRQSSNMKARWRCQCGCTCWLVNHRGHRMSLCLSAWEHEASCLVWKDANKSQFTSVFLTEDSEQEPQTVTKTQWEGADIWTTAFQCLAEKIDHPKCTAYDTSINRLWGLFPWIITWKAKKKKKLQELKSSWIN